MLEIWKLAVYYIDEVHTKTEFHSGVHSFTWTQNHALCPPYTCSIRIHIPGRSNGISRERNVCESASKLSRRSCGIQPFMVEEHRNGQYFSQHCLKEWSVRLTLTESSQVRFPITHLGNCCKGIRSGMRFTQRFKNNCLSICSRSNKFNIKLYNKCKHGI